MKTRIIEEDGVFLVCDHIGTLVLEDNHDPNCQIYKIAYDENPNHLPAGSPDSTGGQFASRSAKLDFNAPEAPPRQYHNEAFYKKDTQGEEHVQVIGHHQAISDEERAHRIDKIAEGLDNAETSLELLNLLADPEIGTPELALKQVFDKPRKRLLRYIAQKIFEAQEKEALAGIPRNALHGEENLFSNILEKRGPKSSTPKREIDWSKQPETKEDYLERMPSSVDMLEEEDLGGHAIERHSKEQRAVTRANNDPNNKKSSFYQRLRKQNDLTNKIINRRRSEIARRLGNGEGEKKPFPISVKFKDLVGYVLKRDRKKRLIKMPTRQAKIIIKKDPNSPKGWRVQSSFPELEDTDLPFED